MNSSSSLVLELQRLATDKTNDITDLLRKALLVASKLKVEDFKQWIENELHGYESRPVPDYRTARAQLKAINPYRGYIPFVIGDQELAEKLRGQSFQRLIASPIQRAQETARVLSHALGLPVETEDGLREFDCGVLEGRGDDAVWEAHAALMSAWLERHLWEQRIEGGESWLDIRQRFEPMIQALTSGHCEDSMGDTLLVGHGGTYLAMLPLVLENVSWEYALRHPLGYTAIVVAETVGVGRLRCIRWGDAYFGVSEQ